LLRPRFDRFVWAGGTSVLETPYGVAETNAHATLTIRLLVDKSGQVRKGEIVDAPDPRLAKEAASWFEKLTFHPAVRGQTPVAVWWNGTVLFRPKAELHSENPSAPCIQPDYGDPIREDELTDDIELPHRREGRTRLSKHDGARARRGTRRIRVRHRRVWARSRLPRRGLIPSRVRKSWPGCGGPKAIHAGAPRRPAGRNHVHHHGNVHSQVALATAMPPR